MANKKTNRRTAAGKKTTASAGGVEPGEPSFLVVGIGASAGGLEALSELLENTPGNTGMAFVVVTHQHPGHISLLPELLGKETAMSVEEAADGAQLQPNHVYVAPPGRHLALLNGALQWMEVEQAQPPRLPIDYFFRSLAADQKERAICIVLSGTGTDGTLGMKAVKGESGMAMVQQPHSAKYAGMPSSAIATGLADFVLTPSNMPRQLLAYAEAPYLRRAVTLADPPSVPADALQKIFVLIRSRTGHDFSGYKSSTIRRRIERRLSLHQIDKPNRYARYLQENPQEVDVLFRELLISVTNYFRDAQAWEALTPHLEKRVLSQPENGCLRAWLPGCATGEEAFSLAIVLRESMEKHNHHPDVQIFATDLDTEAVEAARTGQYPDGIAVDVSPERLERYFIREEGTYRIRKEVREMVIFAPHNVIKDPPFTKLDIVSCRNLLIYLNAELQKRLLPIFHYALKPDGLLFLGPSETTGTCADLFEPLDQRWKIFRRKENAAATRALPEIPAQPLAGDEGAGSAAVAVSSVKEMRISTQIEHVLLARFSPASVVVNSRGSIVYIHGHTGMYLEPSQGEPSNNILEMAREGLHIDLAAALRECDSSGGEITREDVRVKTNGGFVQVDFTVTQLHEPEAVRGLLLVTFSPTQPTPSAAPRRSRKKIADGAQIGQLERELQYLRESRRTMLEELETSNEELKSTNEELQSTNEELQSSNEELETSKEEMQSLNEELTTVNAELQSMVEDLSQANDDMQNLLNNTDIATVFLDDELNIKRFTEQAKGLVMLRATDVGRPISELASNLERDDLVADCRAVLRNLAFKEAEVRTKNGEWYLMRIMPYRTAENVIEGLVLTFVDIQRLKAAEQDLRRMSKVFMDSADAIVIVDLHGDVVDLNDEAVRAYGFDREELLGKPINTLVPPAQRQKTTELLTRCRQNGKLRNVDFVRIDRSGAQSPALLTLTRLTDEHGEPDAIAMVISHLSE